ncbi:MAG: hypothetical protein JJE30_16895 [Desulfuromonadales bacterium]|nr:hypothetical protein [Desulfuromonadales bacterium]
MVLVLAVMTGGMNVVPSFADDYRDRDGRHDNGRYEKRGRGHDRGNYYYEDGRRYYYEGGRRYYYEGGRRYYRQPVYRERVYVAPPPVVYAPPEPMGIRIFLPPIIFGR